MSLIHPILLWLNMYYCELCNYITESRSKINYHHIVPSELGGIDDDKNRVYICPNCHNLVYVKESKHGIHSIKCKNSVVIKGWMLSSGGIVLNFINSKSEEIFQNKKN